MSYLVQKERKKVTLATIAIFSSFLRQFLWHISKKV